MESQSDVAHTRDRQVALRVASKAPHVGLSTMAAVPDSHSFVIPPPVPASGHLSVPSAAESRGTLLLHGDSVTAQIFHGNSDVTSLDVVHDARSNFLEEDLYAAVSLRLHEHDSVIICIPDATFRGRSSKAFLACMASKS